MSGRYLEYLKVVGQSKTAESTEMPTAMRPMPMTVETDVVEEAAVKFGCTIIQPAAVVAPPSKNLQMNFAAFILSILLAIPGVSEADLSYYIRYV